MIEKDIYKIVDKSIKKVKWFDKSKNLTESDIEDLVYDRHPPDKKQRDKYNSYKSPFF